MKSTVGNEDLERLKSAHQNRRVRLRKRHGQGEKYSVYALLANEHIFYIGMTRRPLAVRLKGHISDAIKIRADSKHYKWIRECLASKTEISIQAIRVELSKADALRIEDQIIRKLKPALTNSVKGALDYRKDPAFIRAKQPRTSDQATVAVELPFKMESRLPDDISQPVRRLVLKDLITMETTTFTLFISPHRIDQFKVEVDGQPWKERIGWSRIVAAVRRSQARFSQLTH